MYRPAIPAARSRIYPMLCLVLVLLGLGLRLAYLDQKVFWNDEVYSTVPVLGHQVEAITQDWRLDPANGNLTSSDMLQRYQAPAPGSRLLDTVQSLAREEPQNSPLYFILSRLWLDLTGGSPLTMRLLSAGIGLLSLPAMYFLCLELFQSGAIASIGMGLVAVSPLQVIYAQEARQYSLLMTIAFLSSLALLRALRRNTPLSWRIYALTVATGLYAQPFFGFVAIAHAVYGLLVQRFHLKRLISHGRAVGLGLLLFAPWLWITLTGLDRISPWRGRTDLPLGHLLGRWLLNLTRAFCDLPWRHQALYNLQVHPGNPMLYLTLLFSGLVAYGFWVLITTTPRQIWLFVVTLTVFPAIFLVAADVLLGGVRSTIPRYSLPTYGGVELAIAFLLGQGMVGGRSPQPWRWVGAGVLALGIGSCLVMLPAQTWWSKYSNYYDPAIAQLINASPRSVVISESALRLMAISYQLKPETLLYLGDADAPRAAIAFPPDADLYVYDARDSATQLKQQLEHQTHRTFEPVFSQPFEFIDGTLRLWKAGAQ